MAKVEAYYKNINDLIVQEKLPAYKYEYHIADPNIRDTSYITNPNNYIRSANKILYDSLTPKPVNDARGNSYGIEFSLEKRYTENNTKLYGWINYTYSFSNRERDGLIKPFRFDQRHVINIVLNYRILKWLEIGTRWTYATNFPITEPVGISPRVVNDTIVVNPITGKVIFNLDFGGDNNSLSSKKPAYHRLDVRVSAFTHFWNADWTFYIDVINAYNRKNVIGYDYYIDSGYNVKKNTMGMFPILPTIGLNARF
jgi:hypothetical protein